MPVNISEWPTKADAMAALGVGLSQINNLIKQRRLELRIDKRVGMPNIGRVNPKDLARELELRKTRETAVHVMPKESAAPAIRPAADSLPVVRSYESDIPGPMLRSALISAPPLWLTYDEAVMYSGLGRSRLEELVEAGQVQTDRGPHGKIVLRRADLDKLSGLTSHRE